MKMITKALGLALAGGAALCAVPALAQDRTEYKRLDVPQHPDLELVFSMTEYKPGELLPRHLHHGLEALYVAQGAQVKVGDRPPMDLKTGTTTVNMAEVAHGGFTIVGDTALKLLTVHVVEKGKPLYDKAD